MSLTESHVEEAALEWFGELGYTVENGAKLAPGEATSERDSFGDVVLVGRLRVAIRRRIRIRFSPHGTISSAWTRER